MTKRLIIAKYLQSRYTSTSKPAEGRGRRHISRLRDGTREVYYGLFRPVTWEEESERSRRHFLNQARHILALIGSDNTQPTGIPQ